MGNPPQFAVRRNRLDSQFDAMIRDAFGGQLAAVWTPAARFVQSGDDVFVDLELPGTRPEDITVDVLDDTLVVAGRRDMADVGEGEKVLVNEMRSGTFRREFKLGTRIDADAVEADYADGILRIRLTALVAAHRPARVEVRLRVVAPRSPTRPTSSRGSLLDVLTRRRRSAAPAVAAVRDVRQHQSHLRIHSMSGTSCGARPQPGRAPATCPTLPTRPHLGSCPLTPCPRSPLDHAPDPRSPACRATCP